jgi:hypothetical protein
MKFWGRRGLFYNQGLYRTALHFGQIAKMISPLTIISGSSLQLHFGQLPTVESIFFSYSKFLFLTAIVD